MQAFCHAKKNMNFKRIETYIRDVSNYLIGTYLKYLEIANTWSSFGSCQIALAMQKEGSERSPSKSVEIIFLLLQGLGMPQNIIVYICIRPTRICMTCTIGIATTKIHVSSILMYLHVHRSMNMLFQHKRPKLVGHLSWVLQTIWPSLRRNSQENN